jgi:sulfoxide reductase heme-binding subunit YedZ
MQPVAGSSNQPLGTNGDHTRRLLCHHLPLALASALVLVLFMSLPLFGITAYPHSDISSGTFPKQRGRDHRAPIGRGEDHSGPRRIDARRAPEAGPMAHAGRMLHGVGDIGPMGHGGGDTGPKERRADLSLARSVRQFTVGTGYLALGLLALTLLLGPANLLLRRQNPVSNYLRRDVGAWTAIFSVVHVICALLTHVSHGSRLISSFLHFFVAQDGSPLTNSFGLGNWTGLAALVIALGLLATSSDAALRKLKARPWKWLQRLNYALFALVILHAFFYGALLRVTSPFTRLLGLSVIAVCFGRGVGTWLWRRSRAGMAPKVA